MLAAVVLFGNLWLAGRLAPPPSAEGAGSLRSIVDRINEAAQAADERRGVRASAVRRRAATGTGNSQAIVFDAGDLPDLTPLAGWVLGGLALFVALLIGGLVSGAWETVLLYLNRVPFSPTACVTDPIFGKDIGYFLFELPFLRLVQGLFNGIVIAALLLTLARYIVGASRGGLVFSTPIRVHLAVLGGLFLLSVAFGYQLDKLELVYSTRGVATGVSFTDQNAQFLAFDVLTILSGIAAALLVGGAFTRMIWPLGLTIAVWFVASLVIGRIYPEAVQRFSVEPNKYAQEERYIGNNIAMTRLAYDLGDWGNISFTGDQVLTRGPDHERGRHLRERPAVGPASAADDARPAPDRAQVLRLHRRRHRPLRHRRRAAPGDALGARARARAEPERVRLGQPADPLHARRRGRHGPGQRGRQRGPAAAAREQPAAGLDERRADDRPGPLGDLLRRARQLVRRRRGAAERVRLPDRRERHRGLDRDRDALDGDDRHRPRQHADPAAVRGALP